MKLPGEIPVMRPPSAIELRCRRMQADAPESHRMFCVARRKPGSRHELPVAVAGLGVIRVSVGHRDGTSHLIRHGVARVRPAVTVRTRPCRVARIQPLATPPRDSGASNLVSCAVVLPDAAERQALLETGDAESRPRRPIQFLLQEIRNQRRHTHE